MNGLVLLPTFFNLSLNFAIISSLSEPESAPGPGFADYTEFLHLQMPTIYSQCDFSIDHLVMFTCRVFSCVVGRGCLL